MCSLLVEPKRHLSLSLAIARQLPRQRELGGVPAYFFVILSFAQNLLRHCSSFFIGGGAHCQAQIVYKMYGMIVYTFTADRFFWI